MTQSAQLIAGMLRIYLSLGGDVDRCVNVFRDETRLQQLSDDEKMFWLRTLVRSFFAHTEAIIYMLKQAALAYGNEFGYPFTEDEIKKITEQVTKVKDGQSSIEKRYLPFKDNIRFAFKIFAQVYKVEFTLDIQGEGWRAFLAANQIRDSLMHPKTVADIFPTDAGVEDLVTASQWFQSEYDRLLQQVNARLRSDIGGTL